MSKPWPYEETIVWMAENHTPKPQDAYSDEQREFMEFYSTREAAAPKAGLTREEIRSRFNRFRSSPYLNSLRAILRMTPMEYTGEIEEDHMVKLAPRRKGQAENVPDSHVGLSTAEPKPEWLRSHGDYYNYQG